DVVTAVAAVREADAAGTIAVIVRPDSLRQVHDQLQQEFGGDVAYGADSLLSAVVVLTAQASNGLEAASVIIVDPTGIVEGEPRGASALYVAMTRATQRLTLVGELPPAPA